MGGEGGGGCLSYLDWLCLDWYGKNELGAEGGRGEGCLKDD